MLYGAKGIASLINSEASCILSPPSICEAGGDGEMADTRDLKSLAEKHPGSSPGPRTFVVGKMIDKFIKEAIDKFNQAESNGHRKDQKSNKTSK